MKNFKFDPIKTLNLDIPRENRKEALEAAAEYLKTAMLDYIGSGNSPVSGFGKFPGYTPAYKTVKGEQSSSSTVNLELTGELLDALDVSIKGGKLAVDVVGDSELRGKAEGNNLGTYGQSKPIAGKARRFIPVEDETFKRGILTGLRDILSEFEDG